MIVSVWAHTMFTPQKREMAIWFSIIYLAEFLLLGAIFFNPIASSCSLCREISLCVQGCARPVTPLNTPNLGWYAAKHLLALSQSKARFRFVIRSPLLIRARILLDIFPCRHSNYIPAMPPFKPWFWLTFSLTDLTCSSCCGTGRRNWKALIATHDHNPLHVFIAPLLKKWIIMGW